MAMIIFLFFDASHRAGRASGGQRSASAFVINFFGRGVGGWWVGKIGIVASTGGGGQSRPPRSWVDHFV